MMIMIFSVKLVNNKVIDNLLIYLVLNCHSHRSYGIKLVNNKVVDNLLIYLVLNFHSHRPYGLRIIAVRSLLSKILVL